MGLLFKLSIADDMHNAILVIKASYAVNMDNIPVLHSTVTATHIDILLFQLDAVHHETVVVRFFHPLSTTPELFHLTTESLSEIQPQSIIHVLIMVMYMGILPVTSSECSVNEA